VQSKQTVISQAAAAAAARRGSRAATSRGQKTARNSRLYGFKTVKHELDERAKQREAAKLETRTVKKV